MTVKKIFTPYMFLWPNIQMKIWNYIIYYHSLPHPCNPKSNWFIACFYNHYDTLYFLHPVSIWFSTDPKNLMCFYKSDKFWITFLQQMFSITMGCILLLYENAEKNEYCILFCRFLLRTFCNLNRIWLCIISLYIQNFTLKR